MSSNCDDNERVCNRLASGVGSIEDTGTSVSGNTISCTGARLGFALVCCCRVSGGGSSKEIPHGGLSLDEKVEGALELAVVGIESSDGGRSTEMGGGRGRGFGTGPVGKIRSSSMISRVPRGFMTRATSWEGVSRVPRRERVVEGRGTCLEHVLPLLRRQIRHMMRVARTYLVFWDGESEPSDAHKVKVVRWEG